LDEKLAEELLTRHAYGSALEWERNLEKVNHSRGMLHDSAKHSNLTASVLLDVIVGNLKLSAEGDDASGYRVTVHRFGSKSQNYFVVKENGRFKVVTDGTPPSEAGNEALYLLSIGQDSQARSLLDWMRDRMHKGGGDDPLSGPLLPRFWSVGDPADHKAMQRAAAALVAGNAGIRELLPAFGTDWKNATNEQERLNLALLLGTGYATIQDGAALGAVSSEVIAKYPDSYVAIDLVADADAMKKDWSNSNSILAALLARHPDDENLLHLKVRNAEAQGDFALARATLQKLFDDGKAKSFDEKLASPDVEDLFSIPYRRGPIYGVREENDDPGRIRIEPILAATYGGDHVAAQQIRMRFLGLPVRVHRLIASALGRVAARLEEARKHDRSLDPFLHRLSGGFAERKIAGTDRTSAHAFGIAIDLDKSMSDYWRWQKTKPIRWRNRIPQAIVDAFEAEGFIWGGRWYHYDTMHFEYRPELLDDRCRVIAESGNPRR